MPGPVPAACASPSSSHLLQLIATQTAAFPGRQHQHAAPAPHVDPSAASGELLTPCTARINHSWLQQHGISNHQQDSGTNSLLVLAVNAQTYRMPACEHTAAAGHPWGKNSLVSDKLGQETFPHATSMQYTDQIPSKWFAKWCASLKSVLQTVRGCALHQQHSSAALVTKRMLSCSPCCQRHCTVSSAGASSCNHHQLPCKMTGHFANCLKLLDQVVLDVAS